MNSVNMSGRLTAEPELKTTQSGVSVCSYTLAVKRPKVKDQNDFINFVTWRQGAEYLCQYGHKGDVVNATGVLTARKWQDKDGNNRVSFEVVTDTVELVQSKQETRQATRPASPDIQAEWEEVAGDDLPF